MQIIKRSRLFMVLTIGLAAGSVFTTSLLADTVFMKSGKLLSGQITKEDNTNIYLRNSDGTLTTIPRSRVLRTRYGKFDPSAVTIILKNGDRSRVYIVDQDNTDYVVRRELEEPGEYRIAKADVDTVSKSGGYTGANQPVGFGFSLNLLSGGTVFYDGEVYIESETDSSILFRGVVDGYLIPELAFGAYLNYASVSTGLTSESGPLLGVGLAIKPRFFVTGELSVLPSLEIGYRSLTYYETSTDAGGNEVSLENSADGFGVNFNLQVNYAFHPDIDLLFNFGFISQPVGGNADADITWAPHIYFGTGVYY